MNTTTIQLTPKVATVPTHKALQSINEAFSGLFHHSIFVQCEYHSISDDEEVISLRDSSKIITLSIKSVEVPEYNMEGGVA